MSAPLTDELLARFSEFITASIGLHFPRNRWPDLQRALPAISRSFNARSPAECIEQLLVTPLNNSQRELLASHLTIGETYFFRDPASFETLAGKILPELIAARSQTKQLRIWSAACCTGEEAYTIAILLSRLIPNYKNWSIELLASDINPAFIQKARRGRYSAWSFRGAPPWLLERYFDRTPNDHYQIAPFIRDMVQFRIVNLVDDLQPLPAIGMANIDLIFCRNVLMYFSEQQMQKVVRRLHHLQAENGYLFVSASELLQLSSSPYRVVRSDGTIYFQKSSARTPTAQSTLNTEQIPLIATAATWRPPPSPKPPAKPRPPSIAPAVAPPVVTPSATERLRALAESLANRGELTEALTTCNAWLVADKLDPQCHYLRGLILQEQNEVESAIDALQKTLYLDPTFVMAHFNLGIIARRLGQRDNATRNLRNARQLLIDRPVEQVLSEFEGITAGRCVEIIQSLLGTEQTV